METTPRPTAWRTAGIVLGAIATIGLFLIALAPGDEGSQIAAALGSIPVFILLAVLFMALIVKALRRAPFSGLATGFLAIAGLAAALGGAWLLVFLACSAGGIR